MRTEALEVLDTDARIPYVRRRGDYLYNFWRDADNPRGLWRRTTLESYRTERPSGTCSSMSMNWPRADDENWVWAGAEVIGPTTPWRWSSLSRGGADAPSCANSTWTSAISSPTALRSRRPRP